MLGKSLARTGSKRLITLGTWCASLSCTACIVLWSARQYCMEQRLVDRF